MSTCRVAVNGEAREVAEQTPLPDLVAALSQAPTGIAVAVNGEVVPRSAWADVVLRDGDAVEVVTAVQGG
ncbi:MAG: sulfur carrier protein ThiS [Motilibacteraceae bacterium]